MEKSYRIIIGINNMCIGGGQRQLSRMLHNVDLDRFHVHVVTLFKCGKEIDIGDSLPAAVVQHHVTFKNLLDIRALFLLWKLLRSLKPDLVMSSFFFSNTVFRVIKLFEGYPIITREHNTYFSKTKKEMYIDRFLKRASSHVVSVSDEVAQLTIQQQRISTEQSRVIYNGIDVAKITEEHTSHDRLDLRKKYQIPEADTVLLFVGRLVSQKRSDVLMKAFIELCKKKQGYHLCIVGDGSQRKLLELLVQEHGISNQVSFFGSQSNSHPFYVLADIFVSMSECEGMSNTHLEALAHNLPIISTRTGGTSAIVTHAANGFILDGDLNVSFLKAVQWYEESSRELVLQNIKAKQPLFTIEKAAEEYQKLWMDVL